MKTLIELFDECQIENVIAGLHLKPERIVFVGFKEVMTNKRTKDIDTFFKMHGENIALEFRVVGRYDFDAIVKTLTDIVEQYEDCCFDLTGGRELVLAAMGSVSTEKHIPMLQFDVKNNQLKRLKFCDDLPEPSPASMTVAEAVVLNGGVVVPNEEDEIHWCLTEEFKKDIDIVWGLCLGNCGPWNRQASVFGNIEEFNMVDGLWVEADLAFLRRCHKDAFMNEGLIDVLKDSGLIQAVDISEDRAAFRYKNDQVKALLSKAGNALELYAYKTALEIIETNPGFYDDVDIGIYVDWDGILKEEIFDHEYDTRNEIDLIIMRGLIPIFVSCKNGEVKKEALYELSTMAERFGGEYAKKIVLASYVCADGESREYLKQRAKDMKIDIVDNVHLLDLEGFVLKFMERVK